ncbi:WG repeat-containing protein [Ewingella americana]
MIQPVGGVSLRAAIRGALRTGGMMALVGFAYPALAEPGSACFADLNAANGAHQAELALPATQNLCIRSVHEGRAAVQLPAAQIPAAQPSIDQQTPAEAPVQPAQPSTQPTQPASQAAQATDQPAAAETQPAASPSPAAPTGNRWGFLDAQGQLVIKPVFDNVGDFHFGAAKAEQAGKWGYIDATGNWIIKPTFDQAEKLYPVRSGRGGAQRQSTNY